MTTVMIKSVRLKLTFWHVGSLCFLLLLFGLIVYFGLKAILIGNLDDVLFNGGKIFEQSFSEYAEEFPGDPRSLYTIDKGEKYYFVNMIDDEANEAFFVNTVYIQLLGFPGAEKRTYSVIAKTSSLDNLLLPLSPDAYQAVARHTFFSQTVFRHLPFPVRMISLPVRDKDNRRYILQVALSTQHINNTLKGLLFVFGALFPPVLIVIAVIGYVFMKQAFSPIRRMVYVTRKITSEDLSLRLDSIESHDEIGELAETLNAMIDRLDQSFQQITQFSGDVSHELRTPLAQLKCNADIALRKPRTPEEYRQVLRNIVEDADQLQKIIEDLLFLATLDDKNCSSSFMPVALHEVVLEVFETMHGIAGQKGLTFRFEEMDFAEIIGDGNLLKRMFTNLTANAVKYTPSGGVITFSLRQDEDESVLTLSDTGIGIPEEALPYIFDRLYRVDPSRSHDTGGSGLGLTIVRNIVVLHHGKISVDSSPGNGTTFRLSFPRLS